MPQHKRITLSRAENLIRTLQDRHEINGGIADLLRMLVIIDHTLVKHEHTDIARRLRQAFDKVEDDL